jgi:hypothetical protein
MTISLPDLTETYISPKIGTEIVIIIFPRNHMLDVLSVIPEFSESSLEYPM